MHKFLFSLMELWVSSCNFCFCHGNPLYLLVIISPIPVLSFCSNANCVIEVRFDQNCKPLLKIVLQLVMRKIVTINPRINHAFLHPEILAPFSMHIYPSNEKVFLDGAS